MTALSTWLESFCPLCQAHWTKPGHICPSCEARFPVGQSLTIQGLRMESLTQYHPGDWRIRRWILLQKNRFDPKLGQNLWIRWLEGMPPPPRGTWVVSAPGRHAASLAHGFAKQWELFTCSGLDKVKSCRQSEQSRVERRQLSLSWSEKLSRPSRVVFVDDVVTTGSTAMGAYLALGRPRYFQIKCLAYRPLLRRYNGFASMRR